MRNATEKSMEQGVDVDLGWRGVGFTETAEFYYKVPCNGVDIFFVIPNSSLDDLEDVNVGNWEWNFGTVPKSGITIENCNMVEGIASCLDEGVCGSIDEGMERDDSNSDGMIKEDGMLYTQTMDSNSGWAEYKTKDPSPRNTDKGHDMMYQEEGEGEDSDSNGGFSSLAEEKGDDPSLNKSVVFRPLTGREDPTFCNGMIFISKRQLADALRQHDILQGKDGLENAIKELLSVIEHRHCVKHLHNFKSAGFGGQPLKDKIWNLARASYVGRFNALMEELHKEDPGAYVWLSHPDRNHCHWSRSHFIVTPKCDILLNNLCEPFNKVILFARDKPILTMLERLRLYLTDRLVKRRAFAFTWVDDLGPKIHKKIEKVKQRRWDLTGIPCENGAMVIAENGVQPEDYTVEDRGFSSWSFVRYLDELDVGPTTVPVRSF
ncbi:hypothetical protein Vadar_003681 [Vaccinium darrowii]|uniref:Uncharacterized protein n=1 Tax=Vaccinium darrowii TaxID=229202 RepID=A0ACB7Z8U6_9ERIC|nr:hypothetical protein Vadar_003681 [Vaccinium darrowii]